VTGIPADAQLLRVYNSEEDVTARLGAVATLSDGDRPLGFYGVRDWQVLEVTDLSPPGASLTGQFTDVSQVDKFELSEQEYAQRQDTVLAYKQRNKLGRFAPPDSKASTPAASEPSVNIPLNARCEVDSGEDDGLKKRGTVRFVGPTKFGAGVGVWVGIEYDEPIGKNDGSVQGERYFSCKPSFGAFVRPSKVRVGDFPPLDLGLEDDEEM